MINTIELLEFIKKNLETKEITKMQLKTILNKCGCKKRSVKFIETLNQILLDNNISVDPELTSTTPAVNSWVYFSYLDTKLDNISTVSFTPYEHQQLAWNSMINHYSKFNRGMIVIPTGGGKTTIAAKWLCDNYINNGYNVLWLAHRIELLEQAQETFLKFGTAKSSTLITSSKHDSWSNLNTLHKVVLSTDKSCLSKLEYVKKLINQSEKGLYLVVDECHHSVSTSYLNLIKDILNLNNAKTIKLLGLTATPIRMNLNETQLLWKIYDDKYDLNRLENYHVNDPTFNSKIFEVYFSELISKGILSKPIPSTVITNTSLESDLTEKELKYIKSFGDISEEALDKLAKDSQRNRLIVEHYINNKDIFGKTLIFALNIEHCKTLKNEFIHAGISCDFVSHNNPNNKQIIESFKNTDSPRVLLSVTKLTEGFDAPCIKTVFLARPTSSEALFRQMIGRALRGPAAGGTSEAYLVDFRDSWNSFSPISSEFILAPELSDFDDSDKKSKSVSSKNITDKMLDIAYSILRGKMNGEIFKINESIPIYWYQWSEVIDGEEHERTFIVFSNYSKQIDKLIAFVKTNLINSQITNEVILNLYNSFFFECVDPRPDINEINNFVSALSNNVEFFKFDFETSEKFSPISLAKEFKYLRRDELRLQLEVIFNMTYYCQRKYNFEFKNFYNDVSREIDNLFNSEVKDLSIINDLNYINIPSTINIYDFEIDLENISKKLFSMTNENGISLFYKNEIFDFKFIFTTEIIKDYFAKYRSSDKTIIVNRIFNSADIPQFILEYILYSQLCFALTFTNKIDKFYESRLLKFVPTSESIDFATSLNITIDNSIHNFWYNLCDQYLYKLSKVYSINYC